MRRFVLVAAVWFAPALASASGSYPRDLEGYVPTPREPECTLCHLGNITNYDAVRTPFGVSMRRFGLVAGDADSLFRAIDLLATEGIDSDGDGVGDVDELRAGTDPNAPSNATYKPVRYGCAAAPLTNDARDKLAVVLFAFVIVFIVWRARRSRPG